jgi:HSP20 family protein
MRLPADPFLQMQEMNRLFEDTFRGFGLPAAAGARAIAAPRLNVSETDDAIRIEAELPGAAEDDIRVELVDNVITIRGERKAEHEDKDESYHVRECSYGSFARAVMLPFAVRPEQVQASFQNGVLTITVPKSAARETVHQIEVKAGDAGAETVKSVPRAVAGDKPAGGGTEKAAGEKAQATSAQAADPAAR